VNYCKKIEKIYRPYIVWAISDQQWFGYYEYAGERYKMSLSHKANEDRTDLKISFNKKLKEMVIVRNGM
jgi:hypothetical protein